MGVLVNKTSNIKPNLIEVKYKDEFPVYAAINIRIGIQDKMYVFDSIELPSYALNNIHIADDETKYGVLVAHIVKAYYDDNKMSAIVNNYLVDKDGHKDEFNQMQDIRKLAKEAAKEIVTKKLF